MTRLEDRKSKCIVRYSETVRERGKSREIVMELHAYGIRVKLAGMRQWYDISAASVYTAAVLKAVAKAREEKKAKKAGKK